MLTWIRETTQGLPRRFWYLWTGNLINRSGAFVTILLAFYLSRDRGFDSAYVGLVVGLIAAGGAVGVVIGGQLADRWGRRRSLLLAQSLAGVMLLAMGWSHQPWLILVVGVLLGCSQSMARPVYGAMMVDIVPPVDRIRAFTLNYWANNLAFTFASIVGGLVLDVNYLLIFVVNAAAVAATALLIFKLVPETRPDPPQPVAETGTDDPSPRRENPYVDWVFLGVCGLVFLNTMIFMQYQITLPLAMVEDGLDASTYGMVIAVNAVMIVFGQLFVPRLVRSWQRSTLLAVSAVIAGTGFGLTAFASEIWFYAVTVVIWTIGEMLQSPANATMIGNLSPAAARGRYQGMFSLTISAATFLAAVVGGAVMGYFGGTAVWVSCFVLGLVIAALQLAIGPVRERRIREITAAHPAPAQR
ncbi:MFS transporter [Natronosporangium hydrolyticum]|uniref:MFS transporter n=1 Tax=Natronosporangium hydrolyticum TaxID=2811111 RepID=A0A895YH02_9ACTN|nr:MFS transporter [Natronosporangium hydrolyticum]QSB15335.1 MFS transporter [Natronosporangium hydrolyticum]